MRLALFSKSGGDYLGFQFTHPGGVRPRERQKPPTAIRVSIHAPGRGATVEDLQRVEEIEVSIHAPGRGATERRASIDGLHNVSIHAPGRGATKTSPSTTRTRLSFNSRTREGCDGRPTPLRERGAVSIHAPGRGATSSKVATATSTPRFNSRTREGCDALPQAYIADNATFQFTHPGGVRHDNNDGGTATDRVSIHAPGRGATSLYPTCTRRAKSFNSRTREGCDL